MREQWAQRPTKAYRPPQGVTPTRTDEIADAIAHFYRQQAASSAAATTPLQRHFPQGGYRNTEQLIRGAKIGYVRNAITVSGYIVDFPDPLPTDEHQPRAVRINIWMPDNGVWKETVIQVSPRVALDGVVALAAQIDRTELATRDSQCLPQVAMTPENRRAMGMADATAIPENEKEMTLYHIGNRSHTVQVATNAFEGMTTLCGEVSASWPRQQLARGR